MEAVVIFVQYKDSVLINIVLFSWSMNKKYIFLAGVVLLGAVGISSCDSINKITNGLTKKSPVVVAAPVAKVSSLNGKWRLNYITGPRIAFDGLYPSKKPYIVLDTVQLKANGNTGCNNFSGQFKLVGDSVRFGNMATTMMSCVDGGQGETVFLGMLDKVSHYRVSHDTLWFRFKKIDAMRFVRDTSSVM